MKRALVISSIIGVMAASWPAVCLAADMAFSGTFIVCGEYRDFRGPIPPGAAETAAEEELRLQLAIDGGEDTRGLILLGASSLDPEAILLREAYLDLRLSPGAFLRLGRQKIAWGTGFAWNPTNYLGAEKDRVDPAAEGVDLLNLETDLAGLTCSLLAKPAGLWDEWGVAGRMGFPLSGGDLSFGAFIQGDRKGAGGDCALTLGEWVCHAEFAWKAGSTRAYVVDAGGVYEIRLRPADEFFFHGVLGLYRQFPGGSFVLLEYYHNGEGWTDSEAAAYYAADPAIKSDPRLSVDLHGELRRDYLFGLVRKDGFLHDDVSAGLSLLLNLNDGSFLLAPELSYAWKGDLRLAIKAGLFCGSAASEFGSSPAAGTLEAAVELSF